MHLRHQRAGGIDRHQPARLSDSPDLRGHPMGRKEQHSPFGDLLHRIDKHRPLANKPLHDMLVVDDFMKHVDRGPIEADGCFERLDRHVHARTKTARTGQEDFH